MKFLCFRYIYLPGCLAGARLTLSKASSPKASSKSLKSSSVSNLIKEINNQYHLHKGTKLKESILGWFSFYIDLPSPLIGEEKTRGSMKIKAIPKMKIVDLKSIVFLVILVLKTVFLV